MMAAESSPSSSAAVEEDEWYSNLENPENFYSNAAKYWASVPSTVDGMLGGFGDLSALDVASSKNFLSSLINGPSALVHPGRALDCGAGIGRVSKRLLLPIFSEVDLLEQNPAFLEKAKTFLGPSGCRVGHYFPVGLQDFQPEEGHYDVVWIQWTIGHLTNGDLVSFLQRCMKGLSPSGGLIVIKDNFSEEDTFDPIDSSVTRSLSSLLQLIKSAGLAIIKEQDQQNFPSSIYGVKMLALRAESPM